MTGTVRRVSFFKIAAYAALCLVALYGQTSDNELSLWLSAMEGDSKALKSLKERADKGVAFAQFRLGVIYDTGQGAPMDKGQAVGWYKLAADQGLAIAQYNLAKKYAEGDGVSQDETLASEWFKRAAAGGVTAATLAPPPISAEPKVGDWTLFDRVSKMDNTRAITLHANSDDRRVALIVGCENRSVRLAFVSNHGFRLGDINCNTVTNGTAGWLGGGRCVNQTLVRWRFEPLAVLSTYWLERTENSEGARFDTLWKKQVGLIADSDLVRVEFTSIRGDVIEKEIPVKGLKDALPKLAPAGCAITVKPGKRR